MARLRFFIAAPACRVRSRPLIRRQPRHPVSRHDPMHGGGRDRDLMQALEIGRDAPRAKMVLLPEVQDFADDLGRRGPREAVRHPRPIAQADLVMLVAVILAEPRNAVGPPWAHCNDSMK